MGALLVVLLGLVMFAMYLYYLETGKNSDKPKINWKPSGK